MIVIAAGLVGAGFGAWRAKSRGGGRLDMAQYAAAHGIAFALLGLFVALGLERVL